MENDEIFLRFLSNVLQEQKTGEYSSEAEAALGYMVIYSDVAAIAYPAFSKLNNKNRIAILREHAVNTSMKFYKNLMVTGNVLWILKENNIDACVLKGIDLARYYPVPEFRSANDVDVLIHNGNMFETAVKLLEQNGYVKRNKQYSPHHVVFTDREGTVLELHNSVVRPFEREEDNSYIDEVFSQKDIIKNAELFGVEFPVLRDGEKAFYMLLHMLEHFLAAGFGIRLLCDWTLFWKHNTDVKEAERYLDYVNKSGLKTFSDVITYICVNRLGLEGPNVEMLYEQPKVPEEIIDSVLRDILEAGRFGEEDKTRVVSAGDESFMALIREFMHQTRINFPKASRCVFLLPVLWIMTFCIFVKNNRTKRNVRLSQVLKSTRKRATLTRYLMLWK